MAIIGGDQGKAGESKGQRPKGRWPLDSLAFAFYSFILMSESLGLSNSKSFLPAPVQGSKFTLHQASQSSIIGGNKFQDVLETRVWENIWTHQENFNDIALKIKCRQWKQTLKTDSDFQRWKGFYHWLTESTTTRGVALVSDHQSSAKVWKWSIEVEYMQPSK